MNKSIRFSRDVAIYINRNWPTIAVDRRDAESAVIVARHCFSNAVRLGKGTHYRPGSKHRAPDVYLLDAIDGALRSDLTADVRKELVQRRKRVFLLVHSTAISMLATLGDDQPETVE